MKIRRMLITVLILLGVTAAVCLTAGYNPFTRDARAAVADAGVYVVSDQFNVVQIVDDRRSVVCYSRVTPAGASISCVKY